MFDRVGEPADVAQRLAAEFAPAVENSMKTRQGARRCRCAPSLAAPKPQPIVVPAPPTSRRAQGPAHSSPAPSPPPPTPLPAAKQPIAPMLMMLSLGMLLGAAMMKFLL